MSSGPDYAGPHVHVLESVDRPARGAGARKGVGIRLPPWTPIITRREQRTMLIASPGGDALLEVGSRHLVSFDEEYDASVVDVFAPLQLEFPRPGGGKVVVLCEVEDDIGVKQVGDVPGYEHFLRFAAEPIGDITDRYLRAIDADLGRRAEVEDLCREVYVLRVRIIDAQEVGPPEAASAKLSDGLREWDE